MPQIKSSFDMIGVV